jgi:Tol biopolymer transport system component
MVGVRRVCLGHRHARRMRRFDGVASHHQIGGLLLSALILVSFPALKAQAHNVTSVGLAPGTVRSFSVMSVSDRGGTPSPIAAIAPGLFTPGSGGFPIVRSPNGKRVLLYLCPSAYFSPCPQASGGLFVANLDGSNLTGLAPARMVIRVGSGTEGTPPAFSPDGKLVAFSARRADCSEPDPGFGCYELLVARTDGSRLMRIAPEGLFASWSPDGRWLVYVGAVSVRVGDVVFPSAVMAVHPDGSGRHVIVRSKRDPLGSPVFSPRGNLIAYVCNLYAGVCVVRPDGSGHRVLTHGGQLGRYPDMVNPVWSPNGKWVATKPQMYVGGAGEGIVPANGGSSRPLTWLNSSTTGDSDQDWFGAWSPDSRSIIYNHVGPATGTTSGLYRISITDPTCTRLKTSGSACSNLLAANGGGSDTRWRGHQITYISGTFP